MNASLPPVDPGQIAALRRFNRFYTRQLGILAPYLGSDLTLTEVRVLYELALEPAPDQEGHHAAQIGALLGLDAGYLSRILRRFEARRWIRRHRCMRDARQMLLSLTEIGRKAFEPLQQKSIAQAAAMLAELSADERRQAIDAMDKLQALLVPDPAPHQPQVALRALGPGDLGWVIEQHGAIYAREFGLNTEFEALVAQICADYVRKHRGERECGWIAHCGEQRLGAAFVVRKSQHVAQLRMLILVPQARGLGLGARLTDTCIAFARAQRYRKMVLWTQSCLHSARAIYAARGFKLMTSEPYRGFGQDLVSETWELLL